MRRSALVAVMATFGALAANAGWAAAAETSVPTVQEKMAAVSNPTAADRARVDDAIDSGASALRRLVARAEGDPSLATALVEETAVTVTTSGGGTEAPGAAAPTGVAGILGFRRLFAATSGCRGPIYQRTAIGYPGVTIAWRKATVNPFCWDGTRLTLASATPEQWTGVAWCWKEQNAFKSWLIYPTRQKYVNKGTMASVTPWGCSAGQQTISPKVHYERGGGWNAYVSD